MITISYTFNSRLLLAAQRTASLRQDADCQAVLINLLLSNYLSYQLYTQADKLVSKATFPTSAGNPQLARYLYYLGRIRAVQLSYSEAHTHLQQAIRRAPNAKLAHGFYQTVHKLFIIVELLMGDIPDRNLFRDSVLRKALIPYLRIVQGAFSHCISSCLLLDYGSPIFPFSSCSHGRPLPLSSCAFHPLYPVCTRSNIQVNPALASQRN